MKLENLSKRKIALICSILLMLIPFIYGKFLEDNISNRYHHHKMDDTDEKPNIDMVNSDDTIKENFSTHLPLVIIDTDGEEPKADSEWDEEKGYFAHIDHDPYVKGTISIIDNKDSINTINDIPSIKSNMNIRLRGNTSLTFDKKQYLIKFINPDGSNNKQDVLGMGNDHKWILNISFIDKSLIRNYMGLNIAGEIMPHTPDVRYCEVIIKDNDDYEYQGVYLLMESVEQGKDRVNISDYDENKEVSPYLLRRDRYDETGVILDNYGLENKLALGYLDVKYPPKEDITNETIDYITDDINNIEHALFSNDSQEFYKYKDYLDEESFIDYLIINELFTNYDAGYHSTYMYKDINEKLKIGPVWDFDIAFDNSQKHSLKIDSTAMHDTPWFRQLLRSSDFTTQLIDRYKELRKSILSEENLLKYIDETVEFLGPAQMRDWHRWGYAYQNKYLFDTIDEDGNKIDRNTKTHHDEVDKIKNVIIEHGRWLDENIDSLYQFSEKQLELEGESIKENTAKFLFGKGNALQNILAVIFIGIFIISIILIEKY